MPKPSLDWLLVFVPAAVILNYATESSGAIVFAASALAIIPLAAWLSKATEHLAEQTSEGIGGLLNATFGNAAELIIALMALRRGLPVIVKASLTGSIIGNMLLVLGASILAGGMRFRIQHFNPRGARVHATMLLLAAIGFVAPAAFHYLGRHAALNLQAGIRGDEFTLSTEISIVLLVCYLLNLWFSLVTHGQFFSPPASPENPKPEQHGRRAWSRRFSAAVLAGATVLVAWMSHILAGSVEEAAHSFGMTELFIGAIVLAIVGNAAEHSTAVTMAMKNRMDLVLGIAMGSSIQVALFVAPVLVLASYVIGPKPMELLFSPAELLAVSIAVITTTQIASDGESNWLEGVLLLAIYVMFGMLFYLLPGTST